MRRVALLLLSGLSFACAMPVRTFAEPSAAAQLSSRDPYGEYIAEAAQRFEFPAAWIKGVMHAESDGDPRATSPKGAMGLMQVMPQTWAELRVRYRLGDDAYEPHDNIIAGAAYIRELFDRYGSPGWIAAYNAGPSRYEASLMGQALPAETRAYVATVAPNFDGGVEPGSTDSTTAEPHGWTGAPLFIAQRDRGPTADPVSAERAAHGAMAATTLRDVSAIVPQSDGLFVARVSEGSLR